MDGITVILTKESEQVYEKFLKEISEEFNVAFESAYYESIYLYNVNNYYAFTTNGKVKTKGEATSERILDGSNHFNIIPLAIERYLKDNISVENTILNHKELFDFTTAQKVDRQYKVFYNGKVVQQLNRYFISKKGAYLYKSKNDKKMEALMKNYAVYICNEDIRNVDINNYPIDYSYYINKAKEKIELFFPKQLNLF